MKKIKSTYIQLLAFFVFFVLSIGSSMATHIRAGEIVATRTDCQGFTYRIMLVGYTDTGSTIDFGDGLLKFGDGNTIRISSEDVVRTPIDDLLQIEKNVYIIEHTFSGPGIFVISYFEENRNDNILNMDNSVSTPFYIETQIIIDNFFGCNNTPRLQIPPIDQGCKGAMFMHNAGAFDPDGDSLSYEFTIPKQDLNTEVFNYRNPNEQEFYTAAGIDYNKANEQGNGRPTFQIDPVSGNVTWDAPGLAGEYNFAFKIIEWRKIGNTWIQMGYVTRDMQVIIEDCDNNRPDIEIPEDICVVAGSDIIENITATDPDGNNVKLEAFSQILEFGGSAAATFDVPTGFNTPPLVGVFKWEDIICNAVRREPYQVVFKVTDNPPQGVKLVTFKTWNITVVAPPPSLNTVVRSGRQATLNWSKYKDEFGCFEAVRMQVWRRVESNPFTPDECETGMPESAGYQLINVVDIDDVNYVDTGLAYGAKYCYRLVAVFPEPKGGESYVSQEICIEPIDADAPVPTHVTVDKTDNLTGEITVSWRQPFDIDFGTFTKPLRYEVYRAPGFNNGTLELIGSTADTTITDNGLNTRELPYHYVIKAFDANNVEINESVSASSVRLEAIPQLEAIDLNWSADVPWSNQVPGLTHELFRDRVNAGDITEFVKIADIDPLENGLRYFDDGSFNGVKLDDKNEYCYFVKTYGSYGNPKIDIPQINFSQILCAQPIDTIPPCTPRLMIDTLICRPMNYFQTGENDKYDLDDAPCDMDIFRNRLTWEWDDPEECGDDNKHFELYYKKEVNDPYKLKAIVKGFQYIDEDLTSFAGCYQIRAVDRSGNFGEFSEEVCKDNCPNFYLPNAFTPDNNDGYNDVFRTYLQDDIQQDDNANLKCPRFVNALTFRVFNRWGKLVYTYQSGIENPITINWNGKDDAGNMLPSGIYNYQVDVEFDVLDPSKKSQTFKGWVDLKR